MENQGKRLQQRIDAIRFAVWSGIILISSFMMFIFMLGIIKFIELIS